MIRLIFVCSSYAFLNTSISSPTHFISVGKFGSTLANFERDTWPELSRLAADALEAGVHFQNTVLYNRKKDAGTATQKWFAELLKLNPWYKDVVPDVGVLQSHSNTSLIPLAVPCAGQG